MQSILNSQGYISVCTLVTYLTILHFPFSSEFPSAGIGRKCMGTRGGATRSSQWKLLQVIYNLDLLSSFPHSHLLLLLTYNFRDITGTLFSHGFVYELYCIHEANISLEAVTLQCENLALQLWQNTKQALTPFQLKTLKK